MAEENSTKKSQAKKRSLPKVNLKDSKGISPDSIAVIDEGSLKKIINASRRTFTSGITKNSKKVVAPIESFIKTYKTDTLDIFIKMQTTLDDILKVFTESHKEMMKKIKWDKHQSEEDEYQQENEERRRPQRNDSDSDRGEGWFTRLTDFLKKSLPVAGAAAANPETAFDMIKHYLMGFGLVKTLQTLFRSPFKSIGGLLKNPWAIGAAALGNKAYTAATTDRKPDERLANNERSNFVGNFIGQDDEISSDFEHYRDLIVGGAATGFGVGNVPGAILGALAGAGTAYAGDVFGPDAIASLVETARLKGAGLIHAANPGTLDVKDTLEKIELGEKTIEALTKDKDKLMDERVKYEMERQEAEKAGDAERVARLDEIIAKLDKKNLQLDTMLKTQEINIETRKGHIAYEESRNAAELGALAGSLVPRLPEGKKSEKTSENDNYTIGPRGQRIVKPKVVAETKKNIDTYFGKEMDKIRTNKAGFLDSNWDNFQKWWYGDEWKSPIENLSTDPEKLDKTSSTSKPENAKPLKVVTDALKPKSVSIEQMAREKNQSEAGTMSQILNGMTQIFNNNQTVNNNVQNKTVVNRPVETGDKFFGGYGRGGF